MVWWNIFLVYVQRMYMLVFSKTIYNFLRNCQIDYWIGCKRCTSTNMREGPPCSTMSPACAVLWVDDLNYSGGCVGISGSFCFAICWWLSTWNMSLNASWPTEISGVRILFISILHFLIELFGLFVSKFFSSLYILNIILLSDVGLVKIYAEFVGCHFVLLTVCFALQKFFSFKRSHQSFVVLSTSATGFLFRKLSPVPMILRLSSTLSVIRYSVSGFMLRSLIHLDLSFVQGDKYGFICILLHTDLQLNKHHLLKIL